MGMTVRELITKLLEEDMDETVFLQTTDFRFVDEHNKKGCVLFQIEDVEHRNGSPFLNFVDWRVENGNVD